MVNNNWDVLAIAGPSGVGKSCLSYPLARTFDVPLVEADDLFHAVEALTRPVQQPWIHYWRTHPESAQLPAAEVLDLHLKVCRALTPALRAVIDNHIETGMPIVLDGDYILPELAAEYKERLKAVFLYEEDVDQLVHNFRTREPQSGEQRARAEVSALFSQWQKSECERLGLIALPARPWATVLERAVAATGSLKVDHRSI